MVLLAKRVSKLFERVRTLFFLSVSDASAQILSKMEKRVYESYEIHVADHKRIFAAKKQLVGYEDSQVCVCYFIKVPANEITEITVLFFSVC